jgi:hypothetical protein
VSVADLAALIAQPAIEYRPEVRWWLAEGLHTDETLRHEIDTAHRLGFGGMEFLAMDEGAIDHARYGWGAEEWTHDSHVVVEETTKRGMAVSFTSGTNWSNANLPTITPEDRAAAQELDVVHETLSEGSTRSGALQRSDLTATGHALHPEAKGVVREQHLVAVVAVRVLDHASGHDVVDIDSIVDLTGSVVDGTLEWTAPEGEWKLSTYWQHGTGQTANPSASVNYTVNYLDRDGVDAVIDYWDSVVLTPELRGFIAANPRTQMYMDSLELSTYGSANMFWGFTFADEFRRRRGYDITPWLPFLECDMPFMAVSTVYHHQPIAEHATTVAKVRHDYAETLTDLYIENMLRPFATYLHSVGIGLRAEISYGLPFELTRPGPEVDGIETESLEFGGQLDAYRLMSGPTHLFGKQYSSETGATTRNHILPHRFYDQMIFTQLAAGITKTVLHGWASPAGAEGITEWPGHEGMWPMFSERFDTRQPAAEFYSLWNDAIGRYQCLLRQGKPRIDVCILRTDHNTDNLVGVALVGTDGSRILDEHAYERMWMRDRQNHWWQDLGMQDAGWTYEFCDGSLLLRDDVSLGDDGTVQPYGPGYQALIVYQEALAADVAAHLLEWAKRGVRILVVHGTREVKRLVTGEYHHHHRAASRTPGLDGRDTELAAIMAELVAQPSVREIDDPADTVGALRSLGLRGRAEFVAPNEDVVTHLRDTGALAVAYAYHFRYAHRPATHVELALEGEGFVVRVDPWSGAVHPHAGVRYEAGRTIVSLDLDPGETALLVLDRTEAPAVSRAATSDDVLRIMKWHTRVESLDAGEPRVITEDRGLGYVTREVRPTTAVTLIDAGQGPLRPWCDIAEVGDAVSGVGEYEATFSLPDVDGGARYVLDLGSTCGGLGSVRVNDGPAVGFDTEVPRVDVTTWLRPGDNTVTVRVSSSLNNRLLARGYYTRIPDVLALDFGGVEQPVQTSVQPYGLVGPVVLRAERIAAN